MSTTWGRDDVEYFRAIGIVVDDEPESTVEPPRRSLFEKLAFFAGLIAYFGLIIWGAAEGYRLVGR
jgi:hypothetical protein